MEKLLPTIIIRHAKENLQKCSLKGLETRDDFHFITYPFKEPFFLQNYLILTLEDVPCLTKEDSKQGLIILDSTWNYLRKMFKATEKIAPSLKKRSLPNNYRTAYPRNQKGCIDPSRGLASIEALYLAYLILERPTTGLLDHYYWKEQFIKINSL